MTQTALQLILFLFPLAYSPGPGNIFFAANGARFGFRKTMPANFGYHLATWVVTFVIGYGFGAVMSFAPAFLAAVKYLGGAYVLYLAWKLFRAGAIDKKLQSKPAGFWDGVILLLLNPKAYFIIAVLSSQFLVGDAENFLALVLMVATVFTLNNFVAFVVWTAVGDRLILIFSDKRDGAKLNAAFGMILAAVAVWMLVL